MKRPRVTVGVEVMRITIKKYRVEVEVGDSIDLSRATDEGLARIKQDPQSHETDYQREAWVIEGTYEARW